MLGTPSLLEPLAVLRWHLAHVRAAAPPFIGRRLQATRDTVALPIRTDVALFQAGMEVVTRRPNTPGAAPALALYRGDLVAGLAVAAAAEFDNWLYVEQEAARRNFRRGTLAFARWAIEHRAARQALEPLARLVTVDPYCEDAHVMLIEAVEALCEMEHAVNAYERYQGIVRRGPAGSTTAIGLITVGVEHLGPRLRLTHLSARSAVFRLGPSAGPLTTARPAATGFGDRRHAVCSAWKA